MIITGEQIATQSGPIDGTLCRSGKVVLTHWFRSREPLSCSSPKGLTHAESPVSTFRISGGNCEVFCTGSFVLDYSPGLKNSRLPGIPDIPFRPIKPLTLRPFRTLNSFNIGWKFINIFVVLSKWNQNKMSNYKINKISIKFYDNFTNFWLKNLI